MQAFFRKFFKVFSGRGKRPYFHGFSHRKLVAANTRFPMESARWRDIGQKTGFGKVDFGRQSRVLAGRWQCLVESQQFQAEREAGRTPLPPTTICPTQPALKSMP
jgi:hypothetical protein